MTPLRWINSCRSSISICAGWRDGICPQKPDHTLQATGLVNEAYVRLVECQQVDWKDRAHFFAISAQVMQRILIDFARARVIRNEGEERGRPPLMRDCSYVRRLRTRR